MNVLNQDVEKYKELVETANKFIGEGFFYAEEGVKTYIGKVKEIRLSGECIELIPKNCFQLSGNTWEELEAPNAWDFNAVEQWGNLFKTTSESYCMTIRNIATIMIYRDQSSLISKVTKVISAKFAENLPKM